MNNIRWIFNPDFLKYIRLPFILLTISFIVILIVTIVFIKIETKDKKGEQNEKN